MATLSPQSRQAVRECLLSNLKDSINPLLEALECKTLRSRFECATSVISAFMDTVELAVKDFAQDWNAANRDLLISLPTELTRKCFGQLDLRGRITISHVSRGWRRAALADGTLWNEYSLCYTARGSDSVSLEALPTLISRSRPFPFRFSGCPPCHRVSDVFLDVLTRNIDTMGELRIGDEFLKLSHLDAPVLKHLTFIRDTWTDSIELPANWGAKHAPCLESLELLAVWLPPDVLPFRALRTLRAYVPSDGAIAIKFSDVFPNLKKLELSGITRRCIPMLLHLPPSLNTILLRAVFSYTVDYSQFLHSLESCSIRELDIDNAAPSLEALELFVRQSSPSRTMEFTQQILYLRDQARKWTIQYHRMPPLDFWAGGLVHLQCFTVLRLQLCEAWRLHELAGWDRDLPALEELTLALAQLYEHQEAGRILGGLLRSERAGVHMPMLASLTLSSKLRGDDPGDALELFASVASLLLPQMLSNAPRPLASLYLRMHSQHDSPVDDRDVSRRRVLPFFALAQRVVVETVTVDEFETRTSRHIFAGEQSQLPDDATIM